MKLVSTPHFGILSIPPDIQDLLHLDLDSQNMPNIPQMSSHSHPDPDLNLHPHVHGRAPILEIIIGAFTWSKAPKTCFLLLLIKEGNVLVGINNYAVGCIGSDSALFSVA